MSKNERLENVQVVKCECGTRLSGPRGVPLKCPNCDHEWFSGFGKPEPSAVEEKKGCQLQVGDVVRLKSGGPPMTVESVREVEERWMVCTRWFDVDTGSGRGNTTQTCKVTFPQESLVRVEDRKESAS